MNKIKSFLSQKNSYEYELENDRVESFMSVLLIAAIVLLFAIILLQLILFPSPGVGEYILWTLEGIFGIFYFLNRKISSRLAGFIFVITLWISVTLLVLTSGGIKDVSVVAYILCFLIAINVMRFWQALLTGLLSILSVWMIAVFEQKGLVATDQSTAISYATNYTIILLLIGTILYLNRSSLMMSYSKIQKEFSERIHAEKVLHEKESLFGAISNNLTSGMIYQVVLKNDGSRKFTYLSDSVKQLYDISPEEGIADANLIYKRIHQDDIELLLKAENEAAKNFSVFRAEVRMFDPSGGLRWSSLVSTPHKADDDSIIFDGIEFDITEQKRVENALKMSEWKARAVFDISYGFRGLLDAKGIVLDVNKTALDFAGAKLSDVAGKYFWETPWWSHSEDVQNQLREAIMRALKGEIVRTETNHISPDGKIHDIDFTLKPLLDESGKVIFLIPEGRDITESTQAKIKLRQEEERFRTLSSIATEGLMIHQDGVILDANKAFAELIGYENPEALIGKNGLEFIPFESESKKIVYDHFNRNSPETFDIELVRPDGTHVIAETRGVEIVYNGKIARIVYMRDITTRKKLEERERQSISKLEHLSNSSMELINISLEQDFFQAISEKLYKFLPLDGIISISEYDQNTDSYLIKKVAGKSFDLNSSTKALGYDPTALDGKFPPEILKLLSTGKLHKMVADTSGFSNDIPESTKKIIYEFLHSRNNYMMGFVTGEKILGTLSVVLPREIEISDLKIIEAFGNQVAILLEKRKAEETLKAALERSQKEQAVIATIATLQQTPGIEMNEYYKQLTSIAAMAIGVERVGVWLFSDKQTDLKCENLYEVSPDRHSSGVILPLSGFTDEFEPLKSAKYIETNDPLTDPRTMGYVEGYLKPLRITSMLDAVISGSTRNLGLLSFEHVDKKHQWEPDEITFACQLADQIALKLIDKERRLAEKNLQYQSRLQELLMNISSKYINLPLDSFESTITDSMRELAEFVDADRCSIWEYDFQKETISATHEWYSDGQISLLHELKDLQFKMATGWDINRHSKGKSIWIPDSNELSPSWVRENLEHTGVKSQLSVPLLNSGDCIGFISFGWVNNHHTYSGVEHQLLMFFANLIVNIQQRRQAGDALQKSEEKFRQLVENMNDVFFILDTEGIVTYISPSARQLFNYDFPSLIGHSFSEIIYPDDLDKLRLEFQATMNNQLAPREFRYYNRDKQLCWAQTSSIPITSDGKVIGVRGIFSDITRRKADEEALRKLSIAVEQSPASIVITDLTGAIEYVNPRFTSTTGYSMDEVIGKNPHILKSGQTKKEVYFDLWSNITRGKEWRGEFHNKKKNGEFYWEAVSISPIINDRGEITHYLAVKEDITERKESTRRIFDTIIETEERERQRYSHELHDGLGPILSTINLYFQMLAENPESDQKVIIISRVGNCIDEAIQSIKEISYNLSPSVLSNFGIISGIHNFINRLNETDKLHINFNTNIDRRFEKNTEITIYRIITELINNTIKYAKATRTEASLYYSEQDSFLTLEYMDNGCGFDLDEVLSTRKGLGLSNIYQRVNTLNGEINIKSSPGNGINVFIELQSVK